MSNNNSTLGKEASIITLNVNDVRIFVNVNKLNNNVILNIPLVTTARHNSFSVSLDFNLKNLQISEFGKGTRLNFYNALSFLGTGDVKVVNSLNEENIYNINSTFNDETELRFNNSLLRLEDEKGNYLLYGSDINSRVYPSLVHAYNGEEFYLQTSNNNITSITSSLEASVSVEEVIFSYSSSRVNEIIYRRKESTGTYINLYKVRIEYNSSSYINRIKYFRINEEEETLVKDIEISIASSYLIVEDVIKDTGYKLVINESTALIDKIITSHEGWYSSTDEAYITSLTYQDDLTLISDHLGHKTTYGFTKDNKPLGKVDTYYNYQETKLDERKRIVQTIKGINLYSKDNLLKDVLPSEDISIGTEVISSSFPPVINNTCKTIYRSSEGDITYQISKKLYKGDEIVLLFFAKFDVHGTGNVTFSFKEDNEVVYTQTLKQNNELTANTFDKIFFFQEVSSSISSLKVVIHVTSNTKLYVIPGIYVKKVVTSYAYEDNYLLKEVRQNGESSYFAYNTNNDLSLEYGTNQEDKRYEYDSLRNISKEINLFNRYEYTYKENNPYLIENIFVKGNNDELIIKEKVISYDNQDNITQIELANGEEITYSYNKFNELISYEEEGREYQNSYDEEGKLISLKEQSTNRTNQITYNNHKRVSTCSSPLSSSYQYLYLDNKITQVKLYNYNLIKYTYNEETKLLESIRYGENDNYKYDIEYNSMYLPCRIKQGTTTLCSYLYDEAGRLTMAGGQANSWTRRSEYNEKGNISHVEDNDLSMDINYNSKEEEESIIYYSDDNYIEGEIRYSSLDNRDSLLNILSKYKESSSWYVGFIKDFALRTNSKIISPLEEVEEGKSSCKVVRINENSHLIYRLNDSSLRLNNGACICFFFKATSSLEDKVLLYLKGVNGTSEVSVEYKNNKFTLSIKDSSGVNYTLCNIYQTIELNKWNFCAINIANFSSARLRFVGEYSLQINSKKANYRNESLERIYMDINTPSYLSLGGKYNGSSSKVMEGEIGGVILSNGSYVDPYKIDNYYLNTRRIFDNMNLGKRYSFIQTYKINKSNVNGISFYPLIKGTGSLYEGNQNISYLEEILYLEGEEEDERKLFSFNKNNKEISCFLGYGRGIKYKINTSSSLVVSFDFIVDEFVNKEQVLFEGKDENNNTIKVFIDLNDEISLKLNSSYITTGETLDEGRKYSFDLVIKEEGSTYVRRVVAYLDGVQILSSSTSSMYQGLSIVLGREEEGISTSSSLGEEKEVKEIHGSIMNLLLSNTSISDILSIKGNIKGSNKVSEYDDLGRLVKEELKNENFKYSKEYEYKKRISSSQTLETHLFSKEVIKINNVLITERTYETDDLGRITSIEDNLFGNKTYSYNQSGFLIQDNERTYSYDAEGNILTSGVDVLTYNSENHLLVTSINGSQVTYNSSLPLYPSSYKQKSLTFDGKNLISITLPDGNHFEYTYSDLGLRIKRSGNRSGTITYSYSGNKLILQESSSLKLEFLYDEKDNLYGFIKNNNDRYYYLRDALNNILGIINQNGQIVVQYSYTSYGVCSVSGDTSLGIQNPFRYKGYYYDVETNLYYLLSRYYDPSCGRFISPDSIDYLDPTSINGLNLYCYCGNDPINRWDPSGHFAVSTFLIGLAASWVISSIASYYLGEHLVSGASSIYGGVQTITTGISLLAYGPVGWVLGGAAIALGAVNIAFGTAELHQHFTGSNWINDIGITGDLYTGLYIGSSIASAAVSIGGTYYKTTTHGQIAYNAKYWDKGTFKNSRASLKYHYAKHGNGLTPTQYTQSALDFSAFNSSSFKYTYNYNYKNASWYFNNMYGVGGYFTSSGQIITFWF